MTVSDAVRLCRKDVLTIRLVNEGGKTSRGAFVIRGGKVTHFIDGMSLSSCMGYDVVLMHATSEGYITAYMAAL